MHHLWIVAGFLLLGPSVAGDVARDKDEILSYMALDKPFRIHKVNLLWDKARRRLAEEKLAQLYSELKLHDKEELTLKKLKAENGDKDGAKEAQVRKKYLGLLNTYGLAGVVPETTDRHDTAKQKAQEKALFKDKKLQKLWEKAEKSGLTDEERLVLKNEFKHHEEKLQEFHRIKEMTEKRKVDGIENHIGALETEEEVENGMRREIKDEYDRLHRLATNTHEQEFKDDKTMTLWRLAQEADFNEEELESLRQELQHFDVKLSKMRHLETEIRFVEERHSDQEKYLDEENKTQGRKAMDKKLKKHAEVIGKMQRDLEERIVARHIEL